MTSMANTGKAILYAFWKSSCSWRVRTVLNFKQIPYEVVPISIMGNNKQQLSDEFKKMNPMSQVPVLIIDGLTLIESNSILEYLEETRPEKPLLPSSPADRARIRAICDIITSGIQPLQNVGVVHAKLDEIKPGSKGEWSRYFIRRGFQAVETILKTTGGKYCYGDEVTFADVCLAPQVFNARLYKVDLSPFPTIVRIDKELELHPAFSEAHPYNQPDYNTK